MKSFSCLPVILLLGIINLFVSVSITNATTPAQILQTSRGLCRGCNNNSLTFLYEHNVVRLARKEPFLTWNNKLQKYAQNWANKRKADCALEHSFKDGEFALGENIFWGGGNAWTPAQAVIAWADEKKFYHYGSNTCDSGQSCGHYTQIVWKNTTKVGCARVICDKGDTFMTCNYDPPGNFIGQKPY